MKFNAGISFKVQLLQNSTQKISSYRMAKVSGFLKFSLGKEAKDRQWKRIGEYKKCNISESKSKSLTCIFLKSMDSFLSKSINSLLLKSINRFFFKSMNSICPKSMNSFLSNI